MVQLAGYMYASEDLRNAGLCKSSTSSKRRLLSSGLSVLDAVASMIDGDVDSRRVVRVGAHPRFAAVAVVLAILLSGASCSRAEGCSTGWRRSGLADRSSTSARSSRLQDDLSPQGAAQKLSPGGQRCSVGRLVGGLAAMPLLAVRNCNCRAGVVRL